MKTIYLSNQAILFREHRSSLENIFRSWIIPTINEAMIERSVDLRSILIELLFIVLVEIMEVDRVWAEDEIIEWGYADILIHRDCLEDTKNYCWGIWVMYNFIHNILIFLIRDNNSYLGIIDKLFSFSHISPWEAHSFALLKKVIISEL